MHRRKTMWTRVALLAAAASSTPLAFAQANLGAVLDAGGRQLSGDEFKHDVVGKIIRGQARTTLMGASSGSNSIELVYLSPGSIRGSAQASPLGGALGGGASAAVEGTWSIDERDRICTSMRMGAVVLAPRCQFWYAHDNKYFLSDSDSDRSARLISYTPQR